VNTRGKNPKVTVVVVTVVLCVVLLGAAVFLRIMVASKKADLEKKTEKARAESSQGEALIRDEANTEARLAALKDTTLHATVVAATRQDKDELRRDPDLEHEEVVVGPAEFEKNLIGRAEDLAKQCGLAWAGHSLAPFKQHTGGVVDPRAATAGDEAAKKLNQEKFDKLSDGEKRALNRIVDFNRQVAIYARNAELFSFEIKLTGAFEDLCEFVKGIAYTRAGFRFRELIVIRGIDIARSQGTIREDPYGEPELGITLKAVAFQVKAPKASPAARSKGGADDEED
jgi:hypothetical protein